MGLLLTGGEKTSGANENGYQIHDVKKNIN